MVTELPYLFTSTNSTFFKIKYKDCGGKQKVVTLVKDICKTMYFLPCTNRRCYGREKAAQGFAFLQQQKFKFFVIKILFQCPKKI